MIPAMPGAAAAGFLLMLLAAWQPGSLVGRRLAVPVGGAAVAFAARPAQAAAVHLAMWGGVLLSAAGAGADGV